MAFFEGAGHGVGLGELDGECRVRAVVAELGPAGDPDALLGHVLGEEFGAGGGLQVVGGLQDAGHRGGFQGCFDGLFAHGRRIGESDAEGGQDTGHGRHEDSADAERVGDHARVLAARAAEGGQRVPGDVVALLDRDPLDGVGDVGHGDLEVALGDLFRGAVVAGPLPDLAGEGGEAFADQCVVDGLVAVRAEHPGEMGGLDAAEGDVGVGDGERSAGAVAGGSGFGARRVGAHPVAGAVEVEQRAAARRDGVDVEHGRAQPDSGDLGGEDPFVLAGEVRDVRGGAAHVEADDAVEAGELRHPGHADDATGRTGQDGVLAAELAGFGEASVGLHEHQPHALEFIGDVLDVAAQHGRQVGVDHGRVSARDELHQRADLAGERDLREARAGRKLSDGLFVGGVEVAVHADHGEGADPGVVRLLEGLGEGVQVRGAQDRAVGGDPLVDLDDTLVQQLRQFDRAGEDAGAVLVGDAQGVAEAAGDDQEGALALAFQEGVGGDRGAHADGVDLRALFEELPHTRDRRVGVPGRVVGQQFVREQAAVRAPRDDIGEGAASVDPELPACHVCSPLPPCSERPEAVDHVAQNTLVRQLGGRYGPCHMDHFLIHEVPDEDPHHPDGEVEFGGEFGDRLGASRQSSTMSTCSGDSVWSTSGSWSYDSVTTTAIRSRRCWAVLVVRPRVMA